VQSQQGRNDDTPRWASRGLRAATEAAGYRCC